MFRLRAFVLFVVLGWLPACAAPAATSSGRTGPSGSASQLGPPVIFGQVWIDSVTVAVGAQVFTDPMSAVVVTDTMGYFEITRGLLPQQYVIRADLNGVTGQVSTRGPLQPGDNGPLDIFLGLASQGWVPGLGIDTKAGSGASVRPDGRPVRVRCCE